MSVHWGGRGPGHTSRWSKAAGTPTPTPTPTNLYPDETVAVSGNYGTFNRVSFANPGLLFDDAGEEGATARFAGAGLTAINALTSNTAYTVILTFADYVSGTTDIRLRNGAFVEFPPSGGGPVSRTVTTGSGTVGAGSSFDGAGQFKITKIEIFAQ